MNEILTAEAERARVVSEYKALIAEPLPPNRKHLGWGFLLIIPPLLMMGSGLEGTDALVLAGVCALVALNGARLALFGGNKEMAAIRSRAAEGLHALATQFDQLDGDERRTAALLAIIYARYERGPGTFDIYDIEAEKLRIGAALPYVKSVEQVLRSDALLKKPVFTA